MFSFHSFYNVFSPYDNYPFPWKKVWQARVWQTRVPPRFAFFAWTTSLEKILTMDNLRKRNVVVIEWHCMCKCSREILDYSIVRWLPLLRIHFLSWVVRCGSSCSAELWTFLTLGEGLEVVHNLCVENGSYIPHMVYLKENNR